MWLESMSLDQTEAYIKSGRRFSSVSTPSLKEDWAKNFRRWARNPDDLATRKDYQDQQGELQLREKEPPFAEVEEELIRKATEVLEQAKGDPDRWRDANLNNADLRQGALMVSGDSGELIRPDTQTLTRLTVP